MSFTVAAVQLSSKMGDIPGNLDRIAESCRQASEEGADLVVLPECIVGGYTIEGAAAETAITPDHLVEELSARLTGMSRTVSVVVGFYEEASGQPFNSAAWIDFSDGQGELVHLHRKVFLPTYGVFDETRHVQPGTQIRAFETRLGRVGILICEDVWHSINSTILAVQGADLILVPAASPGRGFAGERPANVERYERMMRQTAEEHGVYAVLSSHAGFEGGKGLSGASMIFDPMGEKRAEAGLLTEAVVMCEADLEMCRTARLKSPLLTDLQAKWDLIQDQVADSIQQP
jgi:predicted amidohydrolase